jgi:D-serine deaminase-like pyridoxal phosphate-dependent protein
MEHTQAATVANSLEGLAAPCLVLDVERMERNIARLRAPVVRGGLDRVEAEWPRFGGWK